MVGFKELKAEVDAKMGRVNEMLDVIRQIIKDNIRNDQNEKGLLTQDVDEYLDCLILKQAELDKRLKKDLAHWAKNAKDAKQTASGVKDKIKEAQEKHAREIAQILAE